MQRMRTQRSGQEPKSSVLGLSRRPPAAVLLSELFDLIIILCPLVALKRDRWVWPELGWARHREGREVRPLRGDGERRRDIDAWRGHGPIGIRSRRSVGGTRLYSLHRNRLAQLDAFRLRVAVGDCRQIAFQASLDIICDVLTTLP